ncbi:MAG TPA: CHASE domain-containing protein [Noviherbaspirillum sp.]
MNFTRHAIRSIFGRSPAGAVLALALYVVLAVATIWYSETSRLEYDREHVESLAEERAHAIQSQIDNALSAAHAMATLVRLGKGEVPEFESMTAVLQSFYPGISALQLAPGGVIQRIAPLAGNEKALGHNLLADPERDKEAILARDTGKLTLAGPFPLVQGGLGAAGRLPVYLNDENGNARFWGFVIVLIRFPDALKPANLSMLTESGYNYELWRIHPDTGKKHVIASSSGAPLIQPVAHTLQVPNVTWTLSVAPAKGWVDYSSLAFKSGLALFILMLLVANWRRSE